jgi:tetratricopeptide (TPR) repeat protein
VGDNDSAIRIYQTVLEFKPDDRESLAELEALPQGSSSPTPKPVQTDAVPPAVAEIAEIADEEEIIELSESDILEEPTVEEVPQVSPPAAAPSLAEHHDPLSTLTLAELYEKQGFVAKACEIYRTILADDPNNAQLRAKIAQLEGLEPVEENIPEETADSDFDEDLDFSEPETFDEIPAVLEAPAVEEVVEDSTDSFEPVIPAMEDVEEVSAPLGSPFFEPVSESMLAVDEPDFSISDVSEIEPASLESKDFAPLAHKAADNVVDTLDGWLENIRRIKACR